jgi:hypothetical protein
VAEGFDTQQVKLEKSFLNGGHFENWNFCSGRNKVVPNLIFQNYKAKYKVLCICNSNPMVFNFQKSQQMSTIFSHFFG